MICPMRPDRAWRIVLMLVLLAKWPVARAVDIPSASDACLGGKTETTPSTEFAIIEDGSAVKHGRTTLEWKRCALGQTWNAKTSLCDGRPATYPWDRADRIIASVGSGWRLPTGAELVSIVETCHSSPAINPQVFPNTPSALFWSSSSDTGGVNRAWSVSFFTGKPYRPGKLQTAHIRLVRGTMTVKPP